MIQRLERDGGVNRLRNSGENGRLISTHFVARLPGVGESHIGLLDRFLPGIGSHDDDDVAEIALASVVVGGVP